MENKIMKSINDEIKNEDKIQLEIMELDDLDLDEVAGGVEVNSCTNGSQCQCLD